jgi:hypothetical protein
MTHGSQLRAELIGNIPETQHAKRDEAALVGVYIVVESVRQVRFSNET